jgi:2-aminoadipate transaminase
MTMLDIPQSTQLVLRPGFIELNWGQPDPSLLPVEAVGRLTLAMLGKLGGEALSYGAAGGAGPLMAWIRERIQQTEGQTLSLDEIVITAGNSDAIDQICTLFTQPGDVVLVESPTYHLALRIMNDHPLKLVSVPVDESGLQVDLVAAKVRELKQQGHTVRMLYTIPTHHNPTGISLSADRRQALVDLAVTEGFLILEDDVYRELSYDQPAPPSLWSLAPRGTVLRLGSFAKSLAPGLRLGWLNGNPEQMRRISDSGLRDSGGGVNHFAAMAIGELCLSGGFDTQVALFKSEYSQRRDALLSALAEHLPEGCQWTKPAGGFFIWVTLPQGMDAADLAVKAEEVGLTFLPGARFHLDGRGQNTLRLAFSLYPPHELAQAADRLGHAVRSML